MLPTTVCDCNFKDVKTRPICMALGKEYAMLLSDDDDDYDYEKGGHVKKKMGQASAQQHQQQQQAQAEDSAMTDCTMSTSRTRLERTVRALCVACSQARPIVEEVRLLIQTHPQAARCAPLAASSSNGGTNKKPWIPLFWLCNSGALSEQSSSSVSESLNSSVSATATTASTAALQVLQLLLDAWPESIHATDDDGMTCLHLICRACTTGHYRHASLLACVRFLIQYSSSSSSSSSSQQQQQPSLAEMANRLGILPLHYALRNNIHDAVSLDLIRLLCPTALTATATTADGWNALHIAVHRHHHHHHHHNGSTVSVVDVSVLDYLLQKSLQQQQQQQQQQDDNSDDDDVASLLLMKRTLGQGALPLHLACMAAATTTPRPDSHQRLSVIQFLLQHGPPEALQVPLLPPPSGDNNKNNRCSSRSLSSASASASSGASSSLSSSPPQPPPAWQGNLALHLLLVSTTSSDNDLAAAAAAADDDNAAWLLPAIQCVTQAWTPAVHVANAHGLTPVDLAIIRQQQAASSFSSSSSSTMIWNEIVLYLQGVAKAQKQAQATGTMSQLAEETQQKLSVSSSSSSSSTTATTATITRERRIQDIQAHAQRIYSMTMKNDSRSDDIDIILKHDDLEMARKDQQVVTTWIEKVILDPQEAANASSSSSTTRLQQLIALNDLVLKAIQRATIVIQQQQRQQSPPPVRINLATAATVSIVTASSTQQQRRDDLLLALCRQQPLNVNAIRRALLQDDNDNATCSLVQQRDEFGNIPLHYICANSNAPAPQYDDVVDIVKLLVEVWPDSVCIPNHFDSMLPLHIAVRQGAPFAAIEHLIQSWPNSVKAPNRGGSLPLHVACANGARFDIVQLLHETWRKSTKVLNQYGWNALHSLCAHIRSSSSSSSSVTAMHVNIDDAQNNYIRVVQYLVQQEPGAVHVATYHYQDLPLHMACERSAPLAIIQYLAQADQSSLSSIQTRNAFGQLPLHKACAAMSLSLDTIQYLVELWPPGAMLKDVNGETPLDVLRRTRSHEIKEWLDRNTMMKRSREQQQHDVVVQQQEADLSGGRGSSGDVYPWWQDCPQSNFPTLTSTTTTSTTRSTILAATKKKLLAAALKHDGRAVALVSSENNIVRATNLANEFARDWQQEEEESAPSSSPPQQRGGTRFVLWFNAANEESLRQGYLSAIANITKSSNSHVGVPDDNNSNTTASSTKKRSRHRRFDSSLHALADELMCVLWHLPRHLQWLVVFANVPPKPIAMEVKDKSSLVFFSNESNWWNSRGRILVTTTTTTSMTTEHAVAHHQGSSRLLTISVDQ